MLKRILLFCPVILLFIQIRASGQNCISHEMELQNLELNPELKEIRQQLDQETEYRQKFHGYDKLSTTKKVIPVVFHILHQGGTENITMEQIRNQVAILNEEFNRMLVRDWYRPASG
ncbi:MAG TPA: hypothetical protein PK509_07925, partial [Catalimonadaceae bacterium]|nr:hypothetical protein [Catalimonadaceae bacterium]